MAATYTVKQVADILGYSTNSIYTFLKQNRIKGVRVGKGRFRIPQSELNRLLLTSKGQTGEIKTDGSVVPVTGTIVTPNSGIIPPHEPHSVFSLSFLGGSHEATANIFDWFLGISSVVAGVALYLFNQTFDITAPRAIFFMMGPARILLVGGGIGILMTNFSYIRYKKWHTIFHGVLAVAGVVMTTLLVVLRDMDAVAIYGTLTGIIVLTMFVHLGRILPFVLYLTLLSISAPVLSILFPGDPHVSSLQRGMYFTPAVDSIVLSILSFIIIYFLWMGLYRRKVFFWIGSYVAALSYFLMAFWFAHTQFWSRSFFFMIIALTCMYLPSWEDLILARNRKAHAFAVGVFLVIMTVILSGIAVVHITQLNVITTVKRENIQKVDYARVAMESEIASVKSTVTTSSMNPSLVAAVQKNNITELTDLSRIIYESNKNIHRLILLDKNGQVVSFYPLGEIVQSDLSFRDYFIQARETGRQHISDIFEAVIDNSHRKVVTISSPLFGADKEFAGVFVVSLDLDAISARLQKIAVVDRGEYIVILDNHGKRIMHPSPSVIGTDTEPSDPTLRGIDGETGVGEGDTFEGVHSLIAYAPIQSLGWAIALKAPYNEIYALSTTANIVVTGLIIGCIMVIVFIFQLTYIYKYKPLSDGGSP